VEKTGAGSCGGREPDFGGTSPRADMAPHAALPEDTRLWAALQAAAADLAGCVYDADRIIQALTAGRVADKSTSLRRL